MSSTFHAAAKVKGEGKPDVLLVSSDGMRFFVHARVLKRASFTAYGRPLESSDTAHLSETALLLDIVLFAIYGLPIVPLNAPLPTLAEALFSLLNDHGAEAPAVIGPTSPLTTAILAHAHIRPVDVYALAAAFDVFHMAQTASQYLLSFSLPTLAVADAERIGPVYLTRLWALHHTRGVELKNLISPPPSQHRATRSCGKAEQHKIARAWTLATAYILWKTTPDLASSKIAALLQPLAQDLKCPLCRELVALHIRDIICRWAAVQVSFLSRQPSWRSSRVLQKTI